MLVNKKNILWSIIGITIAALAVVVITMKNPLRLSKEGDSNYSCGTVTVGEMNWTSGIFTANVDKYILEKGYGCTVELLTGATMSIGASLTKKSQPDIVPEFWTRSYTKGLNDALAKGTIIKTGDLFIGGGSEGFWIPKYLVDEYPELKTIEGIKKRPDLFPHPENPKRAGFFTCPPGWNCEISTENLFEFLKMEEAGFDLVATGSQAGLDTSLLKAYGQKEGWIGYYWTPTNLLSNVDMVKVDLVLETNEKEFESCVTVIDCKTKIGSSYPPAPVHTYITTKASERYPFINEYLKKRTYPYEDIRKVLAWIDKNQPTGVDQATYFLKQYPQLWTDWVPEDVVTRINSSLQVN